MELKENIYIKSFPNLFETDSAIMNHELSKEVLSGSVLLQMTPNNDNDSVAFFQGNQVQVQVRLLRAQTSAFQCGEQLPRQLPGQESLHPLQEPAVSFFTSNSRLRSSS